MPHQKNKVCVKLSSQRKKKRHLEDDEDDVRLEQTVARSRNALKRRKVGATLSSQFMKRRNNVVEGNDDDDSDVGADGDVRQEAGRNKNSTHKHLVKDEQLFQPKKNKKKGNQKNIINS
jgi:hypothetical protein